MQISLDTPLRRYLFVGTSVYVLELAVIVIAQTLGASPVLAVGLSFWIGLLVSFLLQKIVTFGDKRTHRRVLVPQIVAFCLLVLFNFGVTILFTKLVSPPVPAVFARTAALAITTIWNFYLYKSKIFSNSNNFIY